MMNAKVLQKLQKMELEYQQKQKKEEKKSPPKKRSLEEKSPQKSKYKIKEYFHVIPLGKYKITNFY